MAINFDEVSKNEAFKNIGKDRLEAIKSIANESGGKSMQEIMMIVMKYNKKLNTGPALKKEEKDIMLKILFENMDNTDREKFKNILKMINMMNK